MILSILINKLRDIIGLISSAPEAIMAGMPWAGDKERRPRSRAATSREPNHAGGGPASAAATTQSRRVRSLPGTDENLRGGFHMRLLLGIIIGGALTVGGAYVADALSGAEAKPMVNWDVVAKNVDSVTTLARAGWKRITG
jgi:hypothetical protein